MTNEERFWTYASKADGCWPWGGSFTRGGYGQIWLYQPGGKRLRRAPRVAWELLVGPIPKGMWVLHTCDNPPCVNPDHLFLGTAQDNSDDKLAKGRGNKGSRHGIAKLDDVSVVYIRAKFGAWPTPRMRSDLAAKFGVSSTAVKQVLKGLSWSHVTSGGKS